MQAYLRGEILDTGLTKDDVCVRSCALVHVGILDHEEHLHKRGDTRLAMRQCMEACSFLASQVSNSLPGTLALSLSLCLSRPLSPSLSPFSSHSLSRSYSLGLLDRHTHHSGDLLKKTDQS